MYMYVANVNKSGISLSVEISSPKSILFIAYPDTIFLCSKMLQVDMLIFISFSKY